MHLVERLYPVPDPAAMIEGLRLASRDYAASGIGTVRDAVVPLPFLDIFQAARDAGALSVRVRAMVSAIGLTSPEQVDALLDGMEKWHGGDDPWLRVGGVKFGLDGGLEAGASELLNESETRGTLAPGHLADYTVWPADPVTLGTDQLRDLMPTQTVLGGRTVHASTA